jgi:ubiquinone/menaquinone biosynthesis C-methylase UbiE
MEHSNQKKAFIDYEANQWFERNREKLLEYTAHNDHVISLMLKFQLAPERVLEIGSSAGYRLNAIYEKFPPSKVHGIEPSSHAIDYGKKKYVNVNFIQGTADSMSMFADNYFNLIIVGFVFYVVDRELLIRTIAEIDRVLKNNGHLIIIDFCSEVPVRKNYHHIKTFEAFSFKQSYEQAFLSTCLYNLIDKSSFHHESTLPDANSDLQDLYTISLLRKDLNGNYK